MSVTSCPECSCFNTKVIDSRGSSLYVVPSCQQDKNVVRRRHKCECGYRWSTYELNTRLVDYLLAASKTMERLEAALAAGRLKIKGKKIVAKEVV